MENIPPSPEFSNPNLNNNKNFLIWINFKIILIFCGMVITSIIFGSGLFILSKNQTASNQTNLTTLNSPIISIAKIATPTATTIQTTTLTPIKKVTSINLKALPLGDNKTSTSPKKGYIFTCNPNFNNNEGAFTPGPWLNLTNKTWDFTKKVSVDGNILWSNASFTTNILTNSRNLTTNSLPYHASGVYPIASTDVAYSYDRNPNSIKENSVSLSVPTTPTLLTTPECIFGEVGIMLSGVPLYDGFDAGGRDAAAYEVQDKCSGHPQVAGQYHYHSPSECVKDTSKAQEHSDIEGYALDGFGIFGKKGESGIELSTTDLDECHGHTHQITWDGKKVNMYHYHMTHDFPYSVGCFRGKRAINGPLSKP